MKCALANGFSWADYTGGCQDLAAQLYSCTAEARYGVHSDVTCDAHCARKNAHLVDELVHAYGCPCTCNAAAAAAVAPVAAPVAAPVVAAPVAAVAQDVVVAAAAEDAAAAEADGDAANL
jgi:hypothetical protein